MAAAVVVVVVVVSTMMTVTEGLLLKLVIIHTHFEWLTANARTIISIYV